MCNSLFQIYFEVNSDWFIFQNGEESIVKGDFTAENGTRILVFSTDQHCRIMARARTICADGTFKVCPKLWYQLFIMNAEVTQGI